MKLLVIIAATCWLTSSASMAQTAKPLAGDAPKDASQPAAQTIQITRSGSLPFSQGSGEHFTGSVSVERLFNDTPTSRTSGGRVTFEAGARSAWHTHPRGQTLIVTAGKGWVQQWGGQIEEMRQGDVVWIPPGVKHWHGATANTSMTHIAIQESREGKVVEWMEKVSDEVYGHSESTSEGAKGMTKEPSAAQKLIGDFDPKLAELTDNVLFGDVWERPGLSKRDRSLITVAALIAMNRPEQLRAHLQRARENGVTKEEVVEVITHLAFYTGWPNAINTVPIARETFK